MNPLVIMALMQGAQMAANYFGGGDQDHESFFENKGQALDNMGKVDTMMNDYGQTLRSYAQRPVQLRSAYAQAPPHYSGGGMPMPLGLTGRDPALDDKSLLSLPGLDFPSSFFPSGSGQGGKNPTSPGNNDPADPHAPPGGGSANPGTGDPSRRAVSGYGGWRDDPLSGGDYADPQANEIMSWLKLAGGGGKP